MLSLFPQLFFLSPLSATLLRICAGLIFAYLAYFHFSNRRAVSEELSRLIGASNIICILYATLEALVAASLLGGFYAQLGALVGFVVAIKVLLIRRGLRELKPLSPLSYALLAAICLSIVVTGAGAFAIDLPL